MSFTTITLYKPNGEPITYTDPTRVSTDNGVLAFYWTRGISDKPQKVITNLPYMIQHDIMSVAMESGASSLKQAGCTSGGGAEESPGSPASELLRSAVRALRHSDGAMAPLAPGLEDRVGSSQNGQR